MSNKLSKKLFIFFYSVYYIGHLIIFLIKQNIHNYTIFMFMNDLKRILRENLKRHIREESENKKPEVYVPENCFGGPKTYAGGLVALIQLLMKDNDRDAKLAVEDFKQFLKGSSKIDGKVVVQILQKHGKNQYISFAGCF